MSAVHLVASAIRHIVLMHFPAKSLVEPHNIFGQVTQDIASCQISLDRPAVAATPTMRKVVLPDIPVTLSLLLSETYLQPTATEMPITISIESFGFLSYFALCMWK